MSLPSTNPIVISVPDAINTASPWVDISTVGAYPEAQLSENALAADEIDIETSASPNAVVGKYVLSLGGNNPSSNVSQQQGGLATQVLPIPMAFVRAVRRNANGTSGISLNIAATNASARGPAGPSGVPVQATLQTDGAGDVIALDGSINIARVQVVTVNGLAQILVTFATPFVQANYSLSVDWYDPTVAPAPMHTFVFNAAAAPNQDGRQPGSVLFGLAGAGGAGTMSAATTQAVIMFTCLGGN